MKKNTTFLILALLFVALLVGAVILYNNLSDQYNSSSLAIQTTPPTTAIPEETTTPTNPPADTTSPTEPPETTAPTIPMAPNFTVTDLDGNTVELYDFLGKPVILNFWASWCGPCRSEMPDIDTAYQTYGQDIQFLIVNLTDGSRETVDTAADYIAQSGYTFPIYFDTSLDAASAYGAYSIPVTYFIGADGRAIAYYPGAMSAGILQQGIDLLLGE